MQLRFIAGLALVGWMTGVQVQAATLTPSGRNTSVAVTFDRMSVPAQLPIWTNENGGYDTNDAPKWGRNTLVCQSRTSNQYGACPTFPVWLEATPAPYPVPVTFTESTTKQTLVLNIYLTKRRSLNNVVVASNLVPLNAFGGAVTPRGDGTDYSAYLPSAELSKFPSAGTWSATLKMSLMQWPATCTGNSQNVSVGCTNATKLADWIATLAFNVTDYGNQQIYLPEFGNAAANVDLGLKIFPGGRGTTNVTGSRSLDMCLYDGNNSDSNRVSLIFQDEGSAAPSRATGLFSVYRKGGDKSLAQDRLDYSVEVVNPLTKGRQVVQNGSEIVWSGTNKGILRRVVLPGQRNSVLCVPAPMELVTPSFTLSSKTAGRYSGTLRIIYTPTTQ
ncbi:phage tail protein [Rouxiella chamberiensis]|nr:phage tail protein [Rouxiella chamberiensis]